MFSFGITWEPDGLLGLLAVLSRKHVTSIGIHSGVDPHGSPDEVLCDGCKDHNKYFVNRRSRQSTKYGCLYRVFLEFTSAGEGLGRGSGLLLSQPSLDSHQSIDEWWENFSFSSVAASP